MVVDIQKLKELKTNGNLIVPGINRRKPGHKDKIIALLKIEPLTWRQVKDKLGITDSVAYNYIRSLEKDSKIIAFDVNGEILYLETVTARKEGLI